MIGIPKGSNRESLAWNCLGSPKKSLNFFLGLLLAKKKSKKRMEQQEGEIDQPGNPKGIPRDSKKGTIGNP